MVPTAENADMLANIPHHEMEDMSVVYRLNMGSILFDAPRRPESPLGEVPKSLEEIVGLCLAKDPDRNNFV